MEKKIGIRVVARIGLLVLVMVLAAACGGGVPQKDYDAVKQQLAKAQQDLQAAQASAPQATSLQQQLTAKEQEVAKLQQRLGTGEGTGTGPAATALQEQLVAKEKEVTDLQKSLGAAQERNPLIWTKLLPTPAPAPTATPRPPGFVPPPAATPPPELVNEVVPFTFYVEHLTGHQITSIVALPWCVPNSQFRRGAHLVWRFEVFDTSTGKRVTGLDTATTIKVVLPHGEEKLARYSKRAGTGPWMWAAAFTIPLDYPLGTFDYQIVVTKDGRTGTFDQDKIALVSKDRGIDSRVQIVE